ncbi:hypothetical protein ACUUL3_12350 [Thiovibrio sp. JS02]
MSSAIRFCLFIAFIFFLISLHTPETRHAMTVGNVPQVLQEEASPGGTMVQDPAEVPMGPR